MLWETKKILGHEGDCCDCDSDAIRCDTAKKSLKSLRHKSNIAHYARTAVDGELNAAAEALVQPAQDRALVN